MHDERRATRCRPQPRSGTTMKFAGIARVRGCFLGPRSYFVVSGPGSRSVPTFSCREEATMRVGRESMGQESKNRRIEGEGLPPQESARRSA